MASATGVPSRMPPDEEIARNEQEAEPLLGRPGDASQVQGMSLLKNLVLGTGILAQLGAILMFIMIWVSVFTKDLILFSGHPLAQSLAVLTLIQSILSLQPTHTAEQKRQGRWVHASLNLAAFLFLLVGVVIIEYNKVANNMDHFHSLHGYLGVITSFVLLTQYLVGFTMWATPSLYGGEENAKSIWKYHRISGYLVLVLLLATVCTAVETSFNKDTLKLKLWAMVALSALILVGILPRIQLQKLGLKRE